MKNHIFSKFLVFIVYFLLSKVCFPQSWTIQDGNQYQYEVEDTKNKEWVIVQKEDGDNGDVYIKYGVLDSVYWSQYYIFLTNLKIFNVTILNDKIFILGTAGNPNEDAYIVCINKIDGSVDWTGRYSFPIKQYFRAIEKTLTGYKLSGSTYDQMLGYKVGKSLEINVDSVGNFLQGKTYTRSCVWSDVCFTKGNYSVGESFRGLPYYNTNGYQDIYISKEGYWVKNYNLDFAEWVNDVELYQNKIYIVGKLFKGGFLLVYDTTTTVSKLVKFPKEIKSVSPNLLEIKLVGDDANCYTLNYFLTAVDGIYYSISSVTEGCVSDSIILLSNNTEFMVSRIHSLCAQYRHYNITTSVINAESLTDIVSVVNLPQAFIYSTTQNQSYTKQPCLFISDVHYKTKEIVEENYRVYNMEGKLMLEGRQINGEYIRLPENFHGMYIIRKGENYWEKRVQL